MKKIVTIVGARPQFIKAATVSRVIRDRHSASVCEVLVHTGQHFDENMSKVFFEELEIPEPAYNLQVSGGGHGEMTGRMLESIEKVLQKECPDWVLIYGDTNSTLAGALAAVKLHVPVAHVEAGLRSFNLRMPEEINRIVADRISTLLLCPTEVAVANLSAEGLVTGVHNVGDVMYDASLFYMEKARERSNILQALGLVEGKYVLATCHRAENTDDRNRLEEILDGLARISNQIPVVLPLHPRTKIIINSTGLAQCLGKVKIVDPVPFFDMMCLESGAFAIVTDSGGVQKEAYFFGVPCITMRDETEWVETVNSGWNHLAGANGERIFHSFSVLRKPPVRLPVYGDGDAAGRTVSRLLDDYRVL